MSQPQHSTVRNRLLRAASAEDFILLQPHLEPMPARLRQVFIAPDAPIEHLYFPESGFVSITADTSAGKVEVGMIGREGLVGASPVLLGVDRSPHEHYVQMPGEGLRIPTSALLEATGRSASLLNLLLRFVQCLVVQTAQTAFANAVCTIETRLARWLLMCRDRVDDDDLHITHEFLSIMLGVHRPGVTIAIQVLEGNRLIKATRGQVRILDRAGLEAAAAESYGVPESEYARLIEGA